LREVCCIFNILIAEQSMKSLRVGLGDIESRMINENLLSGMFICAPAVTGMSGVDVK
jgi:hypothetical protein